MPEPVGYVTVTIPGYAVIWLRDLLVEAKREAEKMRERYVQAHRVAMARSAAEMYGIVLAALEEANP